MGSLTDEGPLRKDSETDLQQQSIQSDISIAKCPTTKVKLNGLVNVTFLLDTGSEVSTLSETVYRKFFSSVELTEMYSKITETSCCKQYCHSIPRLFRT